MTRAGLVLLAAASASLAQSPRSDSAAAIHGMVADAARHAVAGASVELVGAATVQTDTAGSFHFSGVPSGSFIVRISKIGFRPAIKMVALEAGTDLQLPVSLEPTAQDLAPVVVKADSAFTPLNDPAGFERRRRAGTGGTFVLAADIERKHLVSTEQIFHGMPAVQVDTGGIVVIKRGEISLRDIYLTGKKVNQFNMCIGAQVFVDGALMPQPFNVNGVPLATIRSIEVYEGPATTPPALRSPKTICGTVAIWTK